MNQVLVSLILATAGAIFLVTIPSEGLYHPGYGWRNMTRNNTSWYPSRNSSNLPFHRFPRNSPYWGDPAKNASHNYFWGNKSTYDRLLYFTRVKMSSSFLRKRSLDVDFPAKHQRPNGTIYYIQVLDQKPAGDGGIVTILRGGIGYKNVTFNIKSMFNKGFDFTFSIYGR